MLSIIVACDDNFGIGLKNQLPWHFPEDLRYFKEKTLHHQVAMGRKTFDSIGRPLPQRKNIVFTKELKEQEGHNLIFVSDMLNYFKLHQYTTEEIFVIGGAEVYRQALPFCQKIYMTHVEGTYEVDTYFPPILWNNYNIIEKKIVEKLIFAVYERKSDE